MNDFTGRRVSHLVMVQHICVDEEQKENREEDCENNQDEFTNPH